MSRRARTRPNKRQWTADASAIGKVMARVQPFTQPELTSLILPVHLCYQAMRQGTATEADFHSLACMVNVCLVRAESIDELCVQTAQLAQEALMRVLARHTKHKTFALDGPAMQEIETCISLYEQMLQLSTPAQMHAAMQTTVMRMQQGHIYKEAA